MKFFAIVILGCLLACASAEVYYKETFHNLDNWVTSKAKGSEAGKVELSAGKYFGDAEEDKGMKTTQDARFYQVSSKMLKDFSNEGKDLIFQFSVKHEQNIDCGGGYLKILPKGLDQDNFNGDSEYNIMFGPDICGSGTKKTHVIFSNKGKNHLIKKDVKCETDQFTHLYTLIVRPDNTYEVRIDDKEVAKGNLKDDFDMLPPKQIKDPNAKKPADWVDEKVILDPTDKKPENWDDIPSHIPDPEAKKPEDWDDELDGEWEPPLIDNPEYQGEWKQKTIPNPEYKGVWEHPMVPNPDYYEDDKLYAFPSNAFVGLEIWQVKSGTIFDNIIVTDDIKEAEKLAEVTKKLQAAEKTAEEEDRKKREEEEKKRAEEAKAAEPEEEEEEEAEEEKPAKDEL